MEERVQMSSVGKIVFLSSALTLLILLGVAVIVKDQVIHYLQSEITTTTSEPRLVAADTSLPDMIERTNKAVVSVIVTKEVPVYEQYFESFDPWGFFALPRLRENGTESREVGGGSGFVVSADGMIVTNAHVVADTAAAYSVVLSDGTSYTVDVLARDAELDIAIVQINQPIEKSLTVLQFGDSTRIRLGETVVAIGNALAEFQNSVSVGVVSGLARTIVASDAFGNSEELNHVIQTDAAINPGNSGGPLLNLEGEVIGVNVATSRGAENIGFALPAEVVQQAVDSVRQYGEIVRPYLGVRYALINARLAAANQLPVEYGALVLKNTEGTPGVLPGSPAEKAGIAEGDIILSVDGEELRGKDLSTVLRGKAVGDTITIQLLRGTDERSVSVVLEKAPSVQ